MVVGGVSSLLGTGRRASQNAIGTGVLSRGGARVSFRKSSSAGGLRPSTYDSRRGTVTSIVFSGVQLALSPFVGSGRSLNGDLAPVAGQDAAWGQSGSSAETGDGGHEASTSRGRPTDAEQHEELAAAEARLHTMWRQKMQDCPGIEAEVAKLYASATACQVFREWEAEQEQKKKQQRAAKELVLHQARSPSGVVRPSRTTPTAASPPGSFKRSPSSLAASAKADASPTKPIVAGAPDAVSSQSNEPKQRTGATTDRKNTAAAIVPSSGATSHRPQGSKDKAPGQQDLQSLRPIPTDTRLSA